jgi:hypothetical protein
VQDSPAPAAKVALMKLLPFLAIVLLAAAGRASAQEKDALNPGVDPGFKPVLVSVDFTSREVRPGDPVGVTYRFRNDGTSASASDYVVFGHLEWPDASCNNIIKSLDHAPLRATSTWEPGEVVSDGPYIIEAPADKGDAVYHVHVGLYAPNLPGGPRLLDVYAGELKVDHKAPAGAALYPQPLSEDEKARRRRNVAERIKDGVSIDEPGFRFTLDKASGAWQLLDKAGGVLWGSNPEQAVFGDIQMTDGKVTRSFAIRKFDEISRTGGGLVLTVLPRAGSKATGLEVTFTIAPVKDPAGLKFSYAATGGDPWRVTAVTMLQNALATTDDDQGYSVLPKRLGSLVPAADGLPYSERLWTYSNTSMALYGAVKRGSALLVAWPHPETEIVFTRSWPDSPLVAGRRMNTLTLTVRGAANSCSIHPLGRGDYCDMALAYRKIARQRGLLKTWAEKRRECPNVDKLLGAADFKPFVFVHSVPQQPGGQESNFVGFSFDEVAQSAEHWRRDLGIDRAMVVLAGWLHRGYDNQHPDILPACAECGGNEGLAAAGKRIRDCGFLFGLHDNYQDMYRDAPSWDEKYINRDAQGGLKMGGFWAGGQAYQVCAIEQVKLAQRPQNLPGVRSLFGPTIYFIDTVFAWGLVTCEAKEHPMTLADDMKYKSLLCDEAKKNFGMMGSEEGREWAVPHAEYMEGIFGHKSSGDPREIVVPMMPMIYGDCTMFYTHQGDRLQAGDTKRFLDHIIYAAMPVYAFGNHLYWTQPTAQGLPITPLPPKVEPAGAMKLTITYRWQVDGKIADDLYCFVHFTHPRATRPEGIAFQNDHQFATPTSRWQPGTVVEDGPYTVEVPEQFIGESELLFGLLGKDGERLALRGLQSNSGRYHLGTVVAGPDGVTFRPADLRRAAMSFAPDEGWTRGLGETDRFIKNTYEVLSYLQRLTAEHPMTRHEFVTPDRGVERAVFGKGAVSVVVNYGPADFRVGEVVLPQNGFLIESDTFVAFHASRFGGHVYERPALFTLRSLDGKPLAQSGKVRIFHGFGDPRVVLNGKEFTVEREAIVP